MSRCLALVIARCLFLRVEFVHRSLNIAMHVFLVHLVNDILAVRKHARRKDLVDDVVTRHYASLEIVHLWRGIEIETRWIVLLGLIERLEACSRLFQSLHEHLVEFAFGEGVQLLVFGEQRLLVGGLRVLPLDTYCVAVWVSMSSRAWDSSFVGFVSTFVWSDRFNLIDNNLPWVNFVNHLKNTEHFSVMSWNTFQLRNKIVSLFWVQDGQLVNIVCIALLSEFPCILLQIECTQ